jgi:hypothetical protein
VHLQHLLVVLISFAACTLQLQQIEDMKGQSRVIARIRPLSATDKAVGAREACVRDGKQSVALLESTTTAAAATAAAASSTKRAWEVDLVLQVM